MGIQGYTDHMDSKGREARAMVANQRAERARMLATLHDMDMGCITLYMSKREIQVRLQEAGLYRLGVPTEHKADTWRKAFERGAVFTFDSL